MDADQTSADKEQMFADGDEPRSASDEHGSIRERDNEPVGRIASAAQGGDSNRIADPPVTAAGRQRESWLEREVARLRAQAAAVRARAATARARAARDRQSAWRERQRLEAKLRAAHIDALTGVLRREAGELAIAQEVERARRSDGRLVVGFIDVDRLKEVNDRHGHAAGDQVLRTVGGLLRARLRVFDVVYRYGGDEFVCGLSGVEIVDAAERLGSIAAAIESEGNITVSVGMAALGGAGETPAQLISRADAAMLAARTRARTSSAR